MKKAFFLIFVMVISLGYAQKAEKILNKYVEALGGKQNLESVNSLLMKGKMENMGQTFEFEKYQNKNGDGYMKMSMMGMELTVYAIKDGKGFMMNQQMGYDEMTPEDAEKVQKSNKDFFNGTVDLKEKNPNYAGKKEMNGQEYEVIKIKDGENEMELYFDTNDHLLKYIVSSTEEGDVILEFADYKKVNGIKFAHQMITKYGDQEINKIIYDEIILNPANVEEKNFQMPE